MRGVIPSGLGCLTPPAQPEAMRRDGQRIERLVRVVERETAGSNSGAERHARGGRLFALRERADASAEGQAIRRRPRHLGAAERQQVAFAMLCDLERTEQVEGSDSAPRKGRRQRGESAEVAHSTRRS